MKKIFYIVAVCVAFVLICSYYNYQTNKSNKNILSSDANIQSSSSTNSETTDAKNEDSVSDDNKNCVCESECLCQDEESDCDCNQTKSTCACTDENGQTVTLESIETNNSDIEELNPEETSEEDETILEE